MILRRLQHVIQERLEIFPAVALLGPRQAGKTTLAETIAKGRDSLYLDLEIPADRDKLADATHYLSDLEDKLVILDEVQQVPELFQPLRGLIDRGRSHGRSTGRFLLLGSASIDLLRQSGESLAGRVSYVELAPFDVLEAAPADPELLWVRGGFPNSFLSADDNKSLIWRKDFIKTYLQRDIPQLGPRIPAETLRRFWTMLAHSQGGILNAAQLARGLAVDGKTIARYLDLLVDLLLVRRLQPYFINVGKRLVKSPKVYVRDSGILHALLDIGSKESLLGHPVVGSSWEGFVIETLINVMPSEIIPSFYRASTGAEIDLLLEFPSGVKWAVEIKRGLSPKVEKGFYQACEDVKPARRLVVYSGSEHYRMPHDIEVISLCQLAAELTGC